MNNYESKVRQYYSEALSLKKDINSELKHSLKNHERMNVFVKNMGKELVLVQNQRLLKGKPMFADKIIQGLVYDMVDIFIHTVETEATKRIQSETSKYLEQVAAKYKKDLIDSADGELHGEFKDIAEEYGVTFNDSRSESLDESDNKISSN